MVILCICSLVFRRRPRLFGQNFFVSMKVLPLFNTRAYLNAVRCGAVRCGAVRCGAVRAVRCVQYGACGAVLCGACCACVAVRACVYLVQCVAIRACVRVLSAV